MHELPRVDKLSLRVKNIKPSLRVVNSNHVEQHSKSLAPQNDNLPDLEDEPDNKGPALHTHIIYTLSNN